MQKHYQVFSGYSKVGNLIKVPNKEETFAIGIMDTSSEHDLEETLMWYSVNFNHGLHVITTEERFTTMSLSSRYQDVTFIVFDKPPVLGERANAMADTCIASYFFLTRSDVDLIDLNFEALQKRFMSENHPAALTPIIFNKNKELIPTVRTPKLDRKDKIEILSYEPSKNDDSNLCPFLGIAIYNRSLFQRIRGFDTEISSAYYQCLDFGTKCWMFGYPIYSVNDLAVLFYSKQFLIEDRSEGIGTNRFYTRALCVRRIRDKIRLRPSLGMDRHLIAEEIKKKAGLYKTDFKNLCENWVSPEN